jgi:hypothetical protein
MRYTPLLALLLIGCAGPTPGTSNDANPAAIEFQSVPGKVQFNYPASWQPMTDQTLLTLTPADDPSGRNRLMIEKPDLPPHIPGLIPLGAVAAGFVADLRGRYNDVQLADPVDRQVAGSAAKEISAACQSDVLVDVTAILCVHGDAVYILEAQTDAAHASAANEALDMIIQSWSWLQ